MPALLMETWEHKSWQEELYLGKHRPDCDLLLIYQNYYFLDHHLHVRQLSINYVTSTSVQCGFTCFDGCSMDGDLFGEEIEL